MKNCHTKGSDSALESLSLIKIVSVKCLGVRRYMGRGELTSLPGHILVCVGGWDTDVVQISMKNCHIKGSDSALESLSLTKLVSIKRAGVRKYLGGGS